MNEAVEDGVGECRVADDVVPLLDRGLAGDDGRADAVPVLEDFEQIVPVLGAERGEPQSSSTRTWVLASDSSRFG